MEIWRMRNKFPCCWRFPYLLLWNFSDGTGWKILRGAWNLRGTRDTKIQVIEVSVSSLYYLFSVILLHLYWA
jgi:hypothetical protein